MRANEPTEVAMHRCFSPLTRPWSPFVPAVLLILLVALAHSGILSPGDPSLAPPLPPRPAAAPPKVSPRVIPTTAPAPNSGGAAAPDPGNEPGVVQCANLIYGQNQTSHCFSDEFLAQIQKDTNVRTNRRFFPVKLEAAELYQYPFAIMTGDGNFTLTQAQRDNLRQYLLRGGFLVASPSCSSQPFNASFRSEIARAFPDIKLQTLALDHPIFHTVHDINQLQATHGGPAPHIEALEIDGRIALIYSPDGLNDTPNAGPGCCCCGGNEIVNAKLINVNLLAYALSR
jgi:hypothetical protein